MSEAMGPSRIDAAKHLARYAQRRSIGQETSTLRAVARVEADFHLLARVRKFTVAGDQHPDLGGRGLAPAPMNLLLLGTGL